MKLEQYMNIYDLIRPALKNVPPYVPGRSIATAQKENGGIPMVKLSSNENLLGPSPKAVQAMKDVASQIHYYPEPKADTLTARIAEYHGVSPDHVVVANGSNTLLDIISNVFLWPDDEVIFCEPTFSVYKSGAIKYDAKPIALPLTKDLKFDLAAMKNAVTDKTKLVQICNPNNPTASYVGKEALEAFIKSMPERVITVLDEAYMDFVESDDCCSMIHMVDDYNVIVARTFSKIYGLAAARVGYIIARPEIAQIIKANTITFSVNQFATAASLASMDDEEYRKLSYETNKAGRAYLLRELSRFNWKVMPSETNFICIVDLPEPPQKIAKELEKRGVIVRGNFPGILRISVGLPEHNQKLLEAVADYFNCLENK